MSSQNPSTPDLNPPLNVCKVSRSPNISLSNVSFDPCSPLRKMDEGRITIYEGKCLSRTVHVLEHPAEDTSDKLFSKFKTLKTICTFLGSHRNFISLLGEGMISGNSEHRYLVFEVWGLDLDEFLKLSDSISYEGARQIIEGIAEAISYSSECGGLLCPPPLADNIFIEEFRGREGKPIYHVKMATAVFVSFDKYGPYGEDKKRIQSPLGVDKIGGNRTKVYNEKNIGMFLVPALNKIKDKMVGDKKEMLEQYIKGNRFSANGVPSKRHPFNWDSYQILDFYSELSDLLKSDNNLAKKFNGVDMSEVYNGCWSKKISSKISGEPEDDVIFKSIEFGFTRGGSDSLAEVRYLYPQYLVQAIRNSNAHYRPTKENESPAFVDQIKICEYFQKKFPKLLLTAYKFVERFSDNEKEKFPKYFR